MLDFNVRLRQRVQDLPYHGHSAKWIHTAEKARDEDERRKQILAHGFIDTVGVIAVFFGWAS